MWFSRCGLKKKASIMMLEFLNELCMRTTESSGLVLSQNGRGTKFGIT